MKKYIIQFLKKRFVSIFGCATILFILFFSVLLFNENAVYPPILALWVYIIALIIYSIYFFLVFRFRRIILYQEQLFNIRFCDTNAVPLYKGSSVFLSDDWLIFAGKFAFCRQYIKRLSIKTKNNNKGRDYYIKVLAIDHKEYTIPIDSSSSAKKILKWYK